MNDAHNDAVLCRVKWYNTTKGFGFATPETGGDQDWFLHATVLQKAGLNTLGEGALISCEIGEGQKGLSVRRIIEVLDHGQESTGRGGQDRGDRGGFDRGDRGGYDRGDRGGFDRGGDRGGYDRPARAPRYEESTGPEEELTGAVKWYDNVKEFGFITPDDGMKDIFVHKTCLNRAGINQLEPGQKLRILSRTVSKGREVKDILEVLD
ncbi:MAG: cold shock domain-containing protein [Pseudomonadota bacterium]